MPYNSERNRPSSLRLKGYDYTQPGAYFVTICTKNRECLFGEVVGNVVELNEYGRIAAETWQWLALQYAYVELDAWVVMPNHLHGILVITDTCSESDRKPLGSLLGAFKTVSSRRINQLRDTPGSPVWQRDFYDRINRNDRSLQNMREYIANNPLQWDEDLENPNCDREVESIYIPF